MLPVYLFDSQISLSQLERLPRCQLEREYSQQKTQIPWEFVLALDSLNFALAFFGPTALQNVAAPLPGEFVEGLWEKNVFEVFLASGNGSRYQELQLSPDGAWWTALHDAPRKRIVESQSNRQAQIQLTVCDGMFSAGLLVPRSEIGISLTPVEKVRGNVTACFSDGSERRFLSYAKLGKGKPDFHQPHKFNYFFPILCYGGSDGAVV